MAFSLNSLAFWNWHPTSSDTSNDAEPTQHEADESETRLESRHHMPMELMLKILYCCAPETTEESGLVTHWDLDQPEAQTLVSLSRVCRFLREPALQLVYKHCLSVRNEMSLYRLFLTDGAATAAPPAPAAPVPGIRPALPVVRPLGNVTSLYLGRCPNLFVDRTTAMWIRELLYMVSHSLRRLVVDLPVHRMLSPDSESSSNNPTRVTTLMRDGFTQLTRLEEFTSVYDERKTGVPRGFEGPEPKLSDEKSPVWILFPKLRRMTLWNADLNDHFFWKYVALHLDDLETLVLSRPRRPSGSCMKAHFRQFTDRALTVRLAHVFASYQELVPRYTWRRFDPQNHIRVISCDVPTTYDVFDREACRVMTRRGALDGSLYQMTGTLLQALSPPIVV